MPFAAQSQDQQQNWTCEPIFKCQFKTWKKTEKSKQLHLYFLLSVLAVLPFHTGKSVCIRKHVWGIKAANNWVRKVWRFEWEHCQGLMYLKLWFLVTSPVCRSYKTFRMWSLAQGSMSPRADSESLSLGNAANRNSAFHSVGGWFI